MFEDSLIESGGKLKTKSKYWSLVTLGINAAILAALIIWPLLHPEALPTQLMATLLERAAALVTRLARQKASAGNPGWWVGRSSAATSSTLPQTAEP